MANSESDCERFDINVLVVDDNTTTLSIIAGILRSWEYKVVTATSGHDALKTLREFAGMFDIVITDLYMRGMNGFELQKKVKHEFQLPVIMMSADSRKSIMSKSLANGASFYIVKPATREDFRDIWQYAVAARKEKFIVNNNNELLGSKEGESSQKITASQDVNSTASSLLVTDQPKPRKKYGKRKSTQLLKDDHVAGSFRGSKKPKVVWTTSLHNRFLLAIRHIGLNKAVPKRILEIMNVPGLTRENVASHLQKYRIFLRKVAERGLLEGLSDRALRSRFASGLPTSLIKCIQKRVVHPTTTAPSLINQVRLGQQSNFGTNLQPHHHHHHHNNYNNFQQLQCHQPNHHHHHRPVLPAYNGINGGFMTSANALTANGSMSNYGTSLGNHFSSSFNYGSCNRINNNNGKMLVPFGSSILQRKNPATNYNYYPPSHNYSGIQLNSNASLMAAGMDQRGLNSSSTVGYTGGNSNNTFRGLINNNDNMASSVLNTGTNESTQENISGLPPLPQHINIGVRNAGDDENHYSNVNNPLSESEACLLDDNLTDLFLMLDDMQLLNETGDQRDGASEPLISDLPSPFNVEQCLEQFQGVGDHVSSPTTEGSTIALPNKFPSCADEIPNKPLGDDIFANLDPLDMSSVDNSSARNSVAEQDWDMDLIESLFGSADPN